MLLSRGGQSKLRASARRRPWSLRAQLPSIAADGERFVTEHLVDGEARYAVGMATVVWTPISHHGGDLRASDGGGWLFTDRSSLTFAITCL